KADEHAQQVFDIQPQGRRVFDEKHVAILVRPSYKTQAPGTVLRFDIALPEIERFHQVTIRVDNASHATSSLYEHERGSYRSILKLGEATHPVVSALLALGLYE